MTSDASATLKGLPHARIVSTLSLNGQRFQSVLIWYSQVDLTKRHDARPFYFKINFIHSSKTG